MKNLLLLFVVFFFSSTFGQSAFERRMIEAGKPYYPVISAAFDDAWPDASMRSIVAAQIQKESLWNPKARLCVPKPSCSRELGIGLGQFTITSRFNAFQETSVLHPSLRGWRKEDYGDTDKQILAMVVKDRFHYRQCKPLMLGEENRMSCVASSYNGGHGGFLADRRLCSNTAGCDPFTWRGNVAETSLKAKKPLQGYGQSFFQINRGYVDSVVHVYRPKYVPFLGS